MNKRTNSRCCSKPSRLELLTKEIKWSFNGKPTRAILWMLMRRQNKPAKGFGKTARILALGVEGSR